MKKNTLLFKTISLFCLTFLTGSLTAQDLIIASCNVLHQAYYYKNAENRIYLKNRTKLFNQSITSGPLSKADVIGFQEWPNIRKQGRQSESWNKILEKTGREIFVSKNNLPGKTDVVAIACKPSNNYKIKPYYFQDGFPLVSEYHKKTNNLSQDQFLGTKRGDAIAIVLTSKNYNKVGVMNVHLQGGCPPKWKNLYHEFRIWQLKKVIEFQKHIEEKEKAPNMSWIIMGDFNWNFDGKIDEYKIYLRDYVFPKNKGWKDADQQAEKGNMLITTCRITPDNKFTFNEFCRMDYMFYKNIKQKEDYTSQVVSQQKSTFSNFFNFFNFFSNEQLPQTTTKKTSYNLYPKNRHNLISHKNNTPQNWPYFSDHAIVTSTFTA